MNLTYLMKVPHLLRLNILCIHVPCLHKVVHCMACLSYAYPERHSIVAVFRNTLHHRWLSLVLVVSLIDSVLVETSSEAADETAEESVRLLAVGRFAGARGQRAHVITTQRTSGIRAVLQAHPVEHMPAQDRNGKACLVCLCVA